MIKFFEKIRKMFKTFDTYDRVYWEGKLSSALILFCSLILIACIVILILLFN